MDREIKKICLHTYTHTSPQREDYYLDINKKEILSFATTCVDPGGTMLSERSQKKTDKHCMITLVYGSKTLELIETENRCMVLGGSRNGRDARCWSKGTNSVIRFVVGIQSQWVTTLNNTVWYT